MLNSEQKEKELLPNAGRFEPGTDNSIGIFGLIAQLRSITTIGADVVEQRILDLTDLFCAGLKAQGYPRVSKGINVQAIGAKERNRPLSHLSIPQSAATLC